MKRLSKQKIKELNLKYESETPQTEVVVPNIKNTEATLQTLLSTDKSICRYGDGEFNLIFGKDLSFQKYNSELANKLKNILLSDSQNILVSIPDRFANLDMCTKGEADYWRTYFAYNRDMVYSLLNMKKVYYDTEVTRPYMGIKDKSTCKKYFKRVQELWQDKDVIFVEGQSTRLGYNNDLFANTKSIRRIICPARNAYSKYDEIINACKQFTSDKTFIIALGPTATVLAYDLTSCGYRALDLGHIDIEYEWFLRGATKKIPITNKYVNENKRGKKCTTIDDETYKKEIVVDLSRSLEE